MKIYVILNQEYLTKKMIIYNKKIQYNSIVLKQMKIKNVVNVIMDLNYQMINVVERMNI